MQRLGFALNFGLGPRQDANFLPQFFERHEADPPSDSACSSTHSASKPLTLGYASHYGLGLFGASPEGEAWTRAPGR